MIQGFKGGKKARIPIQDGDGIFVQVGEADQFSKATSKTTIEVLDLISEGETEGLVTGAYRYHGGYAGRTGWLLAEHIPYNAGLLPGSQVTSGILHSVFYNDVPIAQTSGKFNFGNVEFKIVHGTTQGATGIGANSIFDDELSITRQINESIIGPNFSYSSKGLPTLLLDEGDERRDRFRGDYDALLLEDETNAKINKKVYRIYNRNTVGVNVNIRINGLVYTELEDKKKYGDSLEYYADFVITVKPIFNNRDKLNQINFTKTEDVNLRGKVSSSPFLFQKRINLEDLSAEPDFLSWEIEIIRKTAEAVHPSITCISTIDSVTEIYSQSYRYPMSCLASNKFDAEFFSQVPETTYEMHLKKIKVPDNYDSISKNYVGDWDGTFDVNKKFSNNPAWVMYDILTDPTYGLGDLIDEDQVDKWSLYEIAQECDILVNDGYSPSESQTSGLEPRFQCDIILNQLQDAHKLLDNLSSVFRGMKYYAGGSIQFSQDVLKEPRTMFTNADVTNGDFTYSSSSRRARKTVAMVRYNDKNDFYKPTIEYIEDPEGVRKNGIRLKDLTAIGTSSRGQAYRLGKWALTTERLETETIAFSAGLAGHSIRPGDVIMVFDKNKTKVDYGGRTLRTKIWENPSGAKILLDRKLRISEDQIYKFTIATPSFNYDPSIVDFTTDFTSPDISGIKRAELQEVYFHGSGTSIESGRTEITFTGETYTGVNVFETGSYEFLNGLAYGIELSGQTTDPCEYNMWKVIRIDEVEDTVYQIYGTQHETGKFNIIEDSARFVDVAAARTIGVPEISDWNVTYTTPITPVNFIVKKGENNKYIAMYVRRSDSDSSLLSSTSRPTDIEPQYTTVPSDTENVNISYRISENGFYDFSFWGFDGSQYSSSATLLSTSKNNGENLVITELGNSASSIGVSSLRGVDQDDNSAGTRDTYVYEGYETNLLWNWSYNKDLISIKDFSKSYKAKVSYYEPGTTNIPKTRLIHSESHKIQSRGELRIGADKNSKLPGGPYRSFDLVVEAEDADTEITSSEGFTRPAGYDILGISNTAPESYNAADLSPTMRGRPNTRSVYLNFEKLKDKIGPEDATCLRGYAVILSGESFTAEDFKVNSREMLFLPKFFTRRDGLDNIEIIPAGRWPSAYIAVILLDVFDQQFMTYRSDGQVNEYIENKLVTTARLNDSHIYSFDVIDTD